MRFRANDRVGAQQVAYILDALLADLFGLAERSAHTDDCSVMLFDPSFPRCDSLLHLCVSRLLGKGVPGGHTRAGLASEEDGEKRIVRAHDVSFFQRPFCAASTIEQLFDHLIGAHHDRLRKCKTAAGVLNGAMTSTFRSTSSLANSGSLLS